MGASKQPTSPLLWIAAGCGTLVVLYLLLSCVVPLVMYGVMALSGGGGAGSFAATPASTPYDLGPPSSGGPMLPPDPNERPNTDAGIAPAFVPDPAGMLDES